MDNEIGLSSTQKRSKFSISDLKMAYQLPLSTLVPLVPSNLLFHETDDFLQSPFSQDHLVHFFLPFHGALCIRLVSHTHTNTIDVIVEVRMTSRDVIVGIGMTSLLVYGHTVCDTRLLWI